MSQPPKSSLLGRSPQHVKRADPSMLSIGISNRDLCTRCGTCVGACPTEAITLTTDFFPKLKSELCIECGLCERSCPGAEVNYQELTNITFGPQPDIDNFDGFIQLTYVGYAADETIRSKGAGGGVITALMWDLLKHGEVDGCIATRMNAERPWEGEYFIARTYEELLQSQGSRYMIIPVNGIFNEIRKLPGRYAYAALPCQVHGFRMLAEEDPVLKQRIHCVIGLFCGGSLEPQIVTDLLRARGIKPTDVKDFQFRGGEWPGKMRAILKNGHVVDLHYSNYKDGAYNYFTGLYMPKRCQTCIDGSGQFSDLSIGDTWTRDNKGDYRFVAHSRILARTDKGVDILRNAVARKTIIAEDVTQDPNYRTHKLQTKRKGTNAPLRVARLRMKGKSAPLYDRATPDATLKEKLTERAVSTILWLAQNHSFRFLVMKFVTSKYSIPLIKLRQHFKKRKYMKK